MRKVLVVDGDRYLLALTRVSLELDGFRVFTASDTEQAWKIWQQEMPDLIILDGAINGEGGLAFCRQIKQWRQGGDEPVIILSTNRLPEEDIRRYQEEGIDWCLTKPFNTVTLGRELQLVLRKKQNINPAD